MIDSRVSDGDQAIERCRQYPRCNRRFTTTEVTSPQVIKWSDTYEPFSRGKIIGEVGKTCQDHLISGDDLTRLAQLIGERVRANGASWIGAHEIGLAALELLREFDTIAYLRFASVHSNYDSLDDFKNVIRELRESPSRSAK